MNKKDINKVVKISESLDWSITVDGNDFEFGDQYDWGTGAILHNTAEEGIDKSSVSFLLIIFLSISLVICPSLSRSCAGISVVF